MDTETPLTETSLSRSKRSSRRLGGLSANQWSVLIVMGGLLVAISAMLALVLRSGGIESIDALSTAMAGPTPTPTPPALVLDAVPTPSELYWPPNPRPLAKPDVPGGLLWWDGRFAYRCPILLDVVVSQSPAGTWVRVIFDGEGAQRESKMRTDGADLRVLVWDGWNWWEIPRRAEPRREKRGWNVLFHLQDPQIAQSGHYYLYYGNSVAGSPPVAKDVPETSRLLLALGDEEGVEWGPEITWTANSTATQTLVSPDGRIVIHRPPGGLSDDVRVRLRTVPVAEKNSYGPLPNFELHADPPPGPPGPSKIAHWDPPLTVTINWAGLPVDMEDLQSWTYFAYDAAAGAWYRVPIEYDPKQGIIRMTTDQL